MAPLAHPSPQPEGHLDRFSRFCAAHDHHRKTDGPHTPSVTTGRSITTMHPNKRPLCRETADAMRSTLGFSPRTLFFLTSVT